MSARLWRQTGFVDDRVTRLEDDAPMPADGTVLVSLKRFLADRDTRGARAGVGVVLQPADHLDDIVVDLPALALVALSFPKFADGRSYSLARLLRERHGYTGELRAVGDVLLDRIPLMLRCGFDTFEVVHEPTILALEDGRLPALATGYQPAGEGGAPPDPEKPWRRAV